MDSFLAGQAAVGETSSPGAFTLSPTEARRKMMAAGLEHSGDYVLKFVQAGVAAGCSRIQVGVQRDSLKIDFSLPDGLNPEPDSIASAVMSVATLPNGWLRHLALGLNASIQSDVVREVVCRTSLGSVVLTEKELKIEDEPGEFSLEVRKQRGLWQSLFGTRFADEYATLTRRCRFAPLELVVDGRPVERPFSSRYWTESGGLDLNVSCFLCEEARPGQALELALPLEHYSDSRESGFGELQKRVKGKSPPLLVKWPEATRFKAVFGLLPVVASSARIIFVKDGVTLRPVRSNLVRSNVVAVMDGNDLTVDLTEFQVVLDEHLTRHLQQLAEWSDVLVESLREEPLERAFLQSGLARPELGRDIWKFLCGVKGKSERTSAFHLGIEPQERELVLLSLPAIKRFAFSAHRQCQAVATNQRLVFWNPDDSESCWALKWWQIAKSEIKLEYSSDLYFRTSDERVLEMALNSVEERDRMLGLIEERCQPYQGPGL